MSGYGYFVGYPYRKIAKNMGIVAVVGGIWWVFGRYTLIDPLSYMQLTLLSSSIMTFSLANIFM